MMMMIMIMIVIIIVSAHGFRRHLFPSAKLTLTD